MSDIASIGDINVDLIVPLKKMPYRGRQVLVDDLQIHGGGCAANFAYACSKLGMKVKLFGKLGNDIFANFVLDILKKSGVNLSGVRTSGKTGVTISLVQKDERSFITYRGSNSELSLEDICVEDIKADLVHLPSFFLLEKMQSHYLDLIESIDALKSFDTGWDPGGWSREKVNTLKKILPEVDLFFPNLAEAKRILGIKGVLQEKEIEKLAGRYIELGVPLVVIKMGKGGCLATDGNDMIKAPAFRVDEVDTTGAGDVFCAGFVVYYLKGKSLERCLKFANAAAALSVTGYGWSSYPTLKEVEHFLSKGP